MAEVLIECCYCEQNKVVKNGKAPNGLQRFRGCSCQRYFQLNYRYNAGYFEQLTETASKVYYRQVYY
ncbi:MAG: IS1 family transposase [Candidatus Symbiodolus clandestinus]